MTHNFTLEYWVDNGWYVGKLKEVPGVFSQGENLDELKVNMGEAYMLLLETKNQNLSADAEFELIADKLAKIRDIHTTPLSDYAVSRASIYEDHS